MKNLLDEKEIVTVAPMKTPPPRPSGEREKNSNGEIPSIAVPGTTAKIFIAESQIRPLDPVVTAISPAHDAGEISQTAPIVIHFSQPMDANSVERVFSTDPLVIGSFSWSPTRDVMTFTPESPGFKPSVTVTVRIGDTARDAVSGRTFYAGFESRYHCAGAAPAAESSRYRK